MKQDTTAQSFLDTSILRAILLGTEAYRVYFNQALESRSSRISNCVKM